MEMFPNQGVDHLTFDCSRLLARTFETSRMQDLFNLKMLLEINVKP